MGRACLCNGSGLLVTWVRIDDGFAEHPKIMGLSDRAFRLHVTALCYCGRNLTDGHLSPPALKMLMASCSATRRHVNELVDAGVWDSATTIHDFTDLNPTADSVKRDRAAARDRQRRHRHARNAVTDAVTNGVSHGTPVPVQALPRELIKAVPADHEIEVEIDKLLRSLKTADDGTRGVLLSIACKLPLAKVAKVRESCEGRGVGAGYAVRALQAELADAEEVA